MKKEKAQKLSVVLIGLGVILFILPAFDLFPGSDGLLLAGLACFISAFGVTQIAKQKEAKRWKKK